VIGVIGQNGSGKSTLLQLLCNTLSPSCGNVHVNGRLAALLELGAGFNLDFTGWENIRLSAALYGLSHAETEQKIEAIAAFADIGDL
jgi:lipopolysaccharide transport system ATP-binding protein